MSADVRRASGDRHGDGVWLGPWSVAVKPPASRAVGCFRALTVCTSAFTHYSCVGISRGHRTLQREVARSARAPVGFDSESLADCARPRWRNLEDRRTRSTSIVGDVTVARDDRPGPSPASRLASEHPRQLDGPGPAKQVGACRLGSSDHH
jgi:hypothetical protein